MREDTQLPDNRESDLQKPFTQPVEQPAGTADGPSAAAAGAAAGVASNTWLALLETLHATPM